MAENTEGKKISQLSNYKGGFDAAAEAGAVFPVAVGAENYKIAVRDMQAAIQNLAKAALDGAITQDDFVMLKNKLLLEIENIVSSIPDIPKPDRLITVDDNSKDTFAQDMGGDITLPLAVTIPSASASSAQNTTTAAQPLRTFLKSIRDNIAFLFSNKQDKLIAGTNIDISDNTISASVPSVYPAPNVVGMNCGSWSNRVTGRAQLIRWTLTARSQKLFIDSSVYRQGEVVWVRVTGDTDFQYESYILTGNTEGNPIALGGCPQAAILLLLVKGASRLEYIACVALPSHVQ